MTDHVSDLRWDRLLAGELSSEQADEARAHAAGCARCGARLQELTAGADAFAARPIKIPLRKPRRGVWIGAVGALAAAAVIAIVVTRPSSPTERTKGSGPNLVLEVSRDGKRVALSAGDRVVPGDTLQAGYSSARDGFGAVLSRDGAGGVFAYVPSTGDQMMALPAGDDRTFPQSTTLDEVVGSERVFVIWCEVPSPLAPLLAELRATGEVVAPDRCHVRRVELTKAAR